MSSCRLTVAAIAALLAVAPAAAQTVPPDPARAQLRAMLVEAADAPSGAPAAVRDRLRNDCSLADTLAAKLRRCAELGGRKSCEPWPHRGVRAHAHPHTRP